MARKKLRKIRRTAKWMKKLTMKELRHLAETSHTGRPSLIQLKLNREHQIKQKKAGPHGIEPCWDCRIIAHKLGLEA